MKPSDLKIHRNDECSVQLEWRGVLLTLRANPYYGLAGSLAVKDGDKLLMLEFHGETKGEPFPMCVHEGEHNEEGPA